MIPENNGFHQYSYYLWDFIKNNFEILILKNWIIVEMRETRKVTMNMKSKLYVKFIKSEGMLRSFSCVCPRDQLEIISRYVILIFSDMFLYCIHISGVYLQNLVLYGLVNRFFSRNYRIIWIFVDTTQSHAIFYATTHRIVIKHAFIFPRRKFYNDALLGRRQNYHQTLHNW